MCPVNFEETYIMKNWYTMLRKQSYPVGNGDIEDFI